MADFEKGEIEAITISSMVDSTILARKKLGKIAVLTSTMGWRAGSSRRGTPILNDRVSNQAEDERTRSILDSMLAHVAVLDQQGRIISVNVAWERFARDNAASELLRKGVGFNYLDVCRIAADQGDSTAGSVLKGLQEVLDHKIDEYTLEYPCDSSDVQRWFLMSATPIRQASGGAVVAHYQITDRKLAEAASYKQRERLRAILNAATDAIVTIDRRGIIIEANPSTFQMFGYSEEELIGVNVRILMPQPYSDEHEGYIARYLQTGEPHIIGIGREVIAKRKDGSVFPADLAVGEVDHLHCFTAILRDASERKAIQNQRLTSFTGNGVEHSTLIWNPMTFNMPLPDLLKTKEWGGPLMYCQRRCTMNAPLMKSLCSARLTQF